MLINAPSEITEILYEGQLEYSQAQGQRGAQGEDAISEETPQLESPYVTIGEPQTWNVAEVYQEERKPLPAQFSVLLRDANFFLVRLACSFRTERNVQIEWARFTADLQSQTPAAFAPVAFALHPLEVYGQERSDVYVGVSSALNFKEIDEVSASLGEYVMTFFYPKLTPVITAAGLQENGFSWDMRETQLYPLRGPRYFHVLIKSPRDARGLRITFNIIADVTDKSRVLRFKLNKSVKTQISRLICT
jgi:hypothetical protein